MVGQINVLLPSSVTDPVVDPSSHIWASRYFIYSNIYGRNMQFGYDVDSLINCTDVNTEADH